MRKLRQIGVSGTNTTYLSSVVNRHYGCNFRTLLNRYRVEHAKEVLLSGEVSLVELPLHCGFISRSTFYEAFRKETGLSPKRFEDACVVHWRMDDLEIQTSIEKHRNQRMINSFK